MVRKLKRAKLFVKHREGNEKRMGEGECGGRIKSR